MCGRWPALMPACRSTNLLGACVPKHSKPEDTQVTECPEKDVSVFLHSTGHK